MDQFQESPIQISETSLEELQQICQTETGGSQLFAILDACDEPRVPAIVQLLGEERAVSLYHGAAKRDYCAIAPYLVMVDKEVLIWIKEYLWDDPWGMFVRSRASLEDLRKHFRKYLLVKAPDGEQMYFRFYDPRVFSDFTSVLDTESMSFFNELESVVYMDNGELFQVRDRGKIASV